MSIRKLSVTAGVVALACTLAACGGGGGSSSTSSAPTSSSAPAPTSSSAPAPTTSDAPPPMPLKVTWTYTGPEKDGGYNEINEVAMNAMATVPGVSVNGIYDVPYDDTGSQMIEQAIADGSNVIVDTIGLGDLLMDVCKKHPDVYCYSGADPNPMPANGVSWWLQDWNLGWAAGVAAGLMTKTGTLGMVVPYEIPLAVQAINSYALGCQSVKPGCKVKVVYTNNYFDPAAATQAAKTLVSAGADVLRNITDDPSFCKVADEAGVYAVGEYNDFAAACPKSIITSTVWDFSNYMIGQAKDIQAGNFKSTGDAGPDFTKVSNNPGDPHLGTFGSFVPEDVKAKIQAAYDEMVGGKNNFVGPIKDTKGEVKVKDGVELDSMFLFHGWDWMVEGVTASGG